MESDHWFPVSPEMPQGYKPFTMRSRLVGAQKQHYQIKVRGDGRVPLVFAESETVGKSSVHLTQLIWTGYHLNSGKYDE